MDARDAVDIAIADNAMDDDEDNAAMNAGDFDNGAEQSMAMAPTMAGVPEEREPILQRAR